MSYFVGYAVWPPIWTRAPAGAVLRAVIFTVSSHFSGEVTHEAMIGKVVL